MKKFEFGLKTVLDYNLHMLDNVKNEYAELLKYVRVQEELLATTTNRYKRHNAEFRLAEQEGMTIAEAMGYESGLRVLEKQIKAQKKELDIRRERAELKRLELVAAKVDTKTLETLQEKNLDEYKKQEIKAQEKLMDEFVSIKKYSG